MINLLIEFHAGRYVLIQYFESFVVFTNYSKFYIQNLQGAISKSRINRIPSPGTAVVSLILRSGSMMLE
jgi:hypothetical protein